MKTRKIFVKFCLLSIALSAFYATGVAQTIGSGRPRQEKLLNGLKILMWNDAKASNVGLRIRIHSGSAFDPQGKEGLMRLVAENIFPTPESRDFFKEDLEGSIEIIDNYDYIQINATASPGQFLTLLETIARAVSNPTIDKETTAKLRSQQVERIKQLEKDPAYVADTAAAKRLLGTFPYGRPIEGTTDSLTRIDFADLIDVKQRFLTADNATLAIYGNFDPDLAYKASRRYFGSWLKADKKIPSTFRQPEPPLTAAEIIASPVPGNFEIRYVARGYSVNDKDYAASGVLARIIENRLREKTPAEFRSGVHVRSEGRILPGIIFIGMSGVSSPSVEAKIEANDIVSAAIRAKITDAEFNTAKSGFSDEWNRKDPVDRWLDIDTYKMVTFGAQNQTVTGLTLADVQRVADILAEKDVAVVVVSTPKGSE